MSESGSTESDRGHVVSVALAEFNALRKEISDRSAAQTTILNVNLTAIAAITTFVFSNKINAIALLVFPIVSPCFGMLFFDHASNIDQIGRYLQSDLRRVLVEAAEDPTLLDYENRVRLYERTFFPRGLSLGVPLLVVFAGVPIAALIGTSGLLAVAWARILWGLGIVIVVVFLLQWVAFIQRPFRDDKPAP